MPIIETPGDDAPLSQGDILYKVPLYRTVVTGGEAKEQRSKSPYSMVISRPCNLAHKSDLVIAEIAKFEQNVPKDLERFSQALDFLRTQRDGVVSPDCFYLGELPNEIGRFVARLDSLFTVSAASPKELVSFRLASLNVEFQRDLHVRVFNAFASLGFDDTDWLPTADLEFLKEIAEAEIAQLNGRLGEERAKRARQEFNAGKFSESEMQKLEKSIKLIETSVQPYLDRLAKRKSV